MKSSLRNLFALTLLFTFLINIHSSAQDSAALVNLYKRTGGTSWSQHQNWLTASPLSTWYGVTVTGTRVTALALSDNNLTGAIPDSIGLLTALKSLDFSKNKLTGIPSAIGKLQALNTMNMSANSFNSALPDSIGVLVNLSVLNIHNAKLNGTIPISVGNLVNLTILDLSKNSLTGSIPNNIGNLSKLATLNFTLNQLSGSIPSTIGNLKKLATLELNANKLTGSIPASIGNLSSLYELFLNNNFLSGSIPASIGNATTTQYVDLSENQLSGSIPGTFSKMTHLVNLDLLLNNLSGSIPLSIFKIPTLIDLTLAGNHLTDGPNLSNVTQTISVFTVAIGTNNLTFNTLQYFAGHVPDPEYNPQATIPVHQHGKKLAVSAGGTLSNNTYVWYQASTGNTTTIIGDSTFTPSTNGSYYANIYNSIANQTVLISDTVTFSNAIAAQTPINKLSVYPNPANNIITVKGLNAAVKNNITITDVAGNVRLSFNAGQQSSVQLNISKLPAGNYMLNAKNSESNQSIQLQKQ